jgi:hypothetical protein
MKDIINSKPAFVIPIVCFTLMVASVQAADLVQFNNGNIADADDVNANFNELETRIETITLTPGPVGPASTVAGPTGPAGAASIVAGPTGPAGAASTVAGPTGPAGAASTVAGPTGPAGAASTVAGPKGAAGLGAVVFNTAPTVNDDMNSSYSVGTVWIDTSAANAYILVDNSANAAVWTVMGGSATGSLYAIGDAGPAGGIVFHVTDGGLHGLEAATVDQVSTQWGCHGTLISFANGTVVGTGEQNTADIVAGCNETTAASVAAAYGPGSHFPSEDELTIVMGAEKGRRCGWF